MTCCNVFISALELSNFCRCNAQAAQALAVRSYYYYFFFKKSLCERSALRKRFRDIVTAVIYCYITTFNTRNVTGHFSMWRCYVTTVWIYKGLYGENVKKHSFFVFPLLLRKSNLNSFLGEETRETITRLKGFGSRWKAREQ